jgi:hypothetical protein
VTFHIEFSHFGQPHVAPSITLASGDVAADGAGGKGGAKAGKGGKDEEQLVTQYPHRLFLEAPYGLPLRELLRSGMAFHLVGLSVLSNSVCVRA